MTSENINISRMVFRKTVTYSALLSLLAFNCCKKLIEVNAPTTSITGKNIYTTDATVSSVLTGIYSTMSGSFGVTGSDLTSIGFLTGLSGDELTLFSGATDARLIVTYKNNLTSTNLSISPWASLYSRLYIINAAITGISNSSTLTLKVQQQALGEAKFMRAFCYFYLVNLYGDVPLILGTDFTINNVVSRAPKSKVWDQIIADLKDAQQLLSPNYLDATLLQTTPERVRPTKWSATALLARSYLYINDWKNAELQSTQLIENIALYSLDSLQNVFLKNSVEAIWQLQPVNRGANTEDARTYIITSTGPSDLNPVSLSNQLLKNFEPGDQRKNQWVDTITYAGTLYYFPYKYKVITLNAPVTEYHTILRLAEQYLIRSESRAQQGNLSGALDDLNSIRLRAGLNKIKTNDKYTLLQDIYHEREIELFTEWGHRWFDLKRTNAINSIMSVVTPLKGGTWNSNWQLYPIPYGDILLNKNITQNEGYQ